MVTKDRDFRDSHLLHGSPRKLLVVRTGNSSNASLLALFVSHGQDVVAALQEADHVEVGIDVLVLHRKR